MQFQSINKTKGILYAAVSSSTFGLAPFFSVMLLNIGFSSFEVLSYRWGIASLTLILFGWLSGCNFRLNKKDFGTVFLLSLFRAATSLSSFDRFDIDRGNLTIAVKKSTIHIG